MQQVQGYSPLASGAATLPIALVSLYIAAQVAPRCVNRIGAALTIGIGLLIMGGGDGCCCPVCQSRPTDLTDFVPGYTVVGLGLGLAEMATPLAALAGVREGESGLASGAVETSRARRLTRPRAARLIALGAAVDGTDAFHRSAIGAGDVRRRGRGGGDDAVAAGVPLPADDRGGEREHEERAEHGHARLGGSVAD